MLTIGVPGFLAVWAYIIVGGLFLRLFAYWLASRNEDSVIAKALLFIY